jgi:hypothetical protein
MTTRLTRALSTALMAATMAAFFVQPASAQVVAPESVYVTVGGHVCGAALYQGVGGSCVIHSQPFGAALIVLTNKTTAAALAQVRTDADGYYAWSGTVRNGDVISWKMVSGQPADNWAPTNATYERQASKDQPTLWSGDFINQAPPAANWGYWQYPGADPVVNTVQWAGYALAKGDLDHEVYGPELISGFTAVQEATSIEAAARVPVGSMVGGKMKLVQTALQAIGIGAMIAVKLWNPSSFNLAKVDYVDASGNLQSMAVQPGATATVTTRAESGLTLTDGRAVVLDSHQSTAGDPLGGIDLSSPGCQQFQLPTARSFWSYCAPGFDEVRMGMTNSGRIGATSPTPTDDEWIDVKQSGVGYGAMQSPVPGTMTGHGSRVWLYVWSEGSTPDYAAQLRLRIYCHASEALNYTPPASLWAQGSSRDVCYQNQVAADPAKLWGTSPVVIGPIDVSPASNGNPEFVVAWTPAKPASSAWDAATGHWLDVPELHAYARWTVNVAVEPQLDVQQAVTLPDPPPLPTPTLDPGVAPQTEDNPVGTPTYITNRVSIQWPWCLADLVACMQYMFVPQRPMASRLDEVQQALQLREPFGAIASGTSFVTDLFGFLEADYLRLCVPMLEDQLALQGITLQRPCVTITADWTVFGFQPLRAVYVLSTVAIAFLWFLYGRQKLRDLVGGLD